MEITTSRKPAAPLRTFSKDLAFSLDGHYSPRGKAGLGELVDAYEDLLVISKYGRDFLIEVYHAGELAYGFLFTSYFVKDRSDEIRRGFFTGDQTIYDNLSSYLKIVKTTDNQDVLIFDGAQRRRYTLRLKARNGEKTE